MSPQFYQILHVGSVLFLIATIFAIFAGAPESKRKGLSILVGVLTLLVLVAGFGAATKALQLPSPVQWPVWLWGKVVCWLGIAAIGGMAFKKRSNPAPFIAAIVILVLLALFFVYVKPFAA